MYRNNSIQSEIDQLKASSARLEAIVEELKLEISFYKGEVKRLEWEKDLLNQDMKRMSNLFKNWMDEVQSTRVSSRNIAHETGQFNAMVKYPCKSISDLLQLNSSILLVTSSQAPHFIEYANKQWCIECGWNSSDILGYTCSFLQGPLTDKKVTEAFMKDLKEVGYSRMHVYNYRKNGEMFEVNITVFPVFDSISATGPDSEVAVLTHFASVMTDMKPIPNGQGGGRTSMRNTVSNHMEGEGRKTNQERRSDTNSSDGSEKTSSESGSNSNSGSGKTTAEDSHSNSNESPTNQSNSGRTSHRSSSGHNSNDNSNNVTTSNSSANLIENSNNSSNQNMVGSSNSGSESDNMNNMSDQNGKLHTHTHSNSNNTDMSSSDDNSSNNDLNGMDTTSNQESHESSNGGSQSGSTSSNSSTNFDRRSQAQKFEPKCVISEESFYNFGHTLRLSNLLRLMLSCNNAMILTNKDGKVIHVNTAWCRLTGYSLNEIEGETCKFLQGPDTDHESTKKLKHDLLQDRNTTITVYNYKKNGDRFLNKIIAVPIHGGYLEPGISHYCGLLVPQIEQDSTSSSSPSSSSSSSQSGRHNQEKNPVGMEIVFNYAGNTIENAGGSNAALSSSSDNKANSANGSAEAIEVKLPTVSLLDVAPLVAPTLINPLSLSRGVISVNMEDYSHSNSEEGGSHSRHHHSNHHHHHHHHHRRSRSTGSGSSSGGSGRGGSSGNEGNSSENISEQNGESNSNSEDMDTNSDPSNSEQGDEEKGQMQPKKRVRLN